MSRKPIIDSHANKSCTHFNQSSKTIRKMKNVKKAKAINSFLSQEILHNFESGLKNMLAKFPSNFPGTILSFISSFHHHEN